MSALAPTLKQRFFDTNGAPLVGGKLYSYAAGTTTPKATYTDESAVTANANPVILDANGEANVWLDSGFYKFVLTDALDVPQWTVDRVSAVGASADANSYASGEITLANNVTTFTNITGLELDTTVGETYSVKVDISRFVTGAEVNQSGVIDFIYNSVTQTWEIIPNLNGDDVGVTYTVTSVVGVEQWIVQYKTTNIAGSSYSGSFKFKVKDIF